MKVYFVFSIKFEVNVNPIRWLLCSLSIPKFDFMIICMKKNFIILHWSLFLRRLVLTLLFLRIHFSFRKKKLLSSRGSATIKYKVAFGNRKVIDRQYSTRKFEMKNIEKQFKNKFLIDILLRLFLNKKMSNNLCTYIEGFYIFI